jgi:hypothetical protein
LTSSDTGNIFRVQIEAFNEAGSIKSAIGEFVLASIPDAPDPPTNDASVTNSERIKVDFIGTLPNDRGSSIIGVQLAMDDGQGGDF